MESGLSALPLTAQALLRSLWKRRWLAVGVAWPVALVCGVVISLVPDRFEASALISVDAQAVLGPLMAGGAEPPDVAQQAAMLSGALVSLPSVEQLAGMPALGLASADPRGQAQTVRQLMSRIRLEPAGSGNFYTLSCRDTDPTRAQQVVEATLGLWVEAASTGTRPQAGLAEPSLDEQIKRQEARLIEAENRLEAFHARHVDLLGVSGPEHLGRLSELADEVDQLKVELGAAQRTRDLYRRELAVGAPLPSAAAPAPAPGQGVPSAPSDTDVRLDAQRRHLDDLQRRFTDEHPDVVNTQRVIARLEAQKQQELSQARSAAGDPGMAATGPVPQRIRVALTEAEAEVALLRLQLGEQQKRLGEMQALSGQVPHVEAEQARLNRERDVLRAGLDQLVASRGAAPASVLLGEALRRADFRVVEPPRTLPTPVFPGRLMLAGLAVLATLAAALLAPLVADRIRPTVDDTRTLGALSGRPVLGSLSVSRTDAGRRIARDDLKRLGFAAASLCIVQVGWVGWLAWATFTRVAA